MCSQMCNVSKMKCAAKLGLSVLVPVCLQRLDYLLEVPVGIHFPATPDPTRPGCPATTSVDFSFERDPIGLGARRLDWAGRNVTSMELTD
jgi:hypothetical protein